MLQYKVIEIFTSEKVRWEGRPINEAVVQYVHDLKIAARCLVTRAIDGCYESGEVATGRLEILSYDMPLRIAIVLPAAEIERVLPEVEAMVADGIVAVHHLDVVSHKTRKQLVSRQIKVRDIMTPDPRKVSLTTPLDQVASGCCSRRFLPECPWWTMQGPAGGSHHPGGFDLQGENAHAARAVGGIRQRETRRGSCGARRKRRQGCDDIPRRRHRAGSIREERSRPHAGQARQASSRR